MLKSQQETKEIEEEEVSNPIRAMLKSLGDAKHRP